MPELPEVEVVKRGLVQLRPQTPVLSTQVWTDKIVQGNLALLQGQVLEQVSRRAKYLILHFEKNDCLLHLRMTGQVILSQPNTHFSLPFTYYQKPLETPVDKHTHLGVHFEGLSLYYRDMRKFGRWEVLDKKELENHPSLVKLGIEPLTEAYQWPLFKRALLKSRRAIKALLLDQTVVSGLGNIYVDEALFRSGLHPLQSSATIPMAKMKRLFEVIPMALSEAIEAGGTTLKDYIHPDGTRGSHKENLLVYGRKGAPCYTCGHPIEKRVVAQRGTHFCAVCQVLI